MKNCVLWSRAMTSAVLVWVLLASASPAVLLGQGSSALDQATTLLRSGRVVDAERLIRQELAARPSGRGQYLLGFALLSQYRYAEAENALAAAVQAEPANADWLQALGKAQLEQGKNRAAITTLDRALTLDRRADLYFSRAMCRLNVGEDEAAVSDLRSSLELESRNAEARYKLAMALFNGAEFAASRAQVDLALDIEPEHLEARFLSGLVTQRLGETDAAVAAFETVLNGVPGHVGALLNLGRLQMASGNTEEGRRTLERFGAMSTLQDEADFLQQASDKNPANIAGRLLLAEKLLGLGRTEEALQQALEARRLAPRQARTYRLLEKIFSRLGRSSDALRARTFAGELEKGQ